MTSLGRIKREGILAAGAVLIVLLLGAGFMLVISPYLSSGAQFEKEKAALLSNKQLEQNEYDSFVEYQRVHAKTLGVSDTVSLSFPTNAEVDNLTRQIVTAGEKAGLTSTNISNITTTAPLAKTSVSTTEDEHGNLTSVTTVEPVARMEVGIVTSGTSDQVINFINNLAEMDRAILVSSVNYSSPPGASSESRASLSAISYLYEPLVDPSVTPETTEDTANGDTEADIDSPQ